MLFTTSWDDGYASDVRLADLLSQYGMTGTFYVCPLPQHDQPMLEPGQIKEIAARHEIGAHTLTHPHLVCPDREFVEQEVRGSKRWVEEVTGTPCTMFCYPYGDFDGITVKIVRDAGFAGARTTESLQFSSRSPFMLPTTLQVAPFPKRRAFTRWWHRLDPYGPLRAKKPRLGELGIPRSASSDWFSLARALLEHAIHTEQPFFHLWGHSAEVDRYGMWGELEAFLSVVQQADVRAEPNSALAS